MIRNHYKESKIRITLLIEYLKARTLFEIRITPQARFNPNLTPLVVISTYHLIS